MDRTPNACSEPEIVHLSSDENKEDKTRMADIFVNYVPLYNHILKGNWQQTKIFLDQNPKVKTCPITAFDATVIHVAVWTDVDKEFFHFLVNSLPNECQFEAFDVERKTALHYAAMVGNTEAAKILVNKNPNLTMLMDLEDATPLHLAAKFAHKETTRYLLCKTMEIAKVKRPIKPDSSTPPGSGPFEKKVGAELLNSLIMADYYDLAIIVVKNYEHLALETDLEGVSALEKLAQNPHAFLSGTALGFFKSKLYNYISVEKNNVTRRRPDVENPDASGPECITEPLTHIGYLKPLYETKLMNKRAEELASKLCEAAVGSAYGIEFMAVAFSIAVRMGISEMVSQIITAFPDVIFFMDGEHRFMSHIAVEERKENVYNLIYEMGLRKNILLSTTDNDKNSVLHLAAKLGPPSSSSGAVLQLQRELQWYKEVEDVVQPSYKTMLNEEAEDDVHPSYRIMLNAEGRLGFVEPLEKAKPKCKRRTPKQVFTEEHAELVKKGEEWMKGTAGSCSTVASLITTVAFAGAFTLPGGNNDDGTPVYLQDLSFLIFSISNALALFASATAVLMFLSILTSRYLEEDFLKTLPTRMIIGLTSLFLSIAFMLAAFCSALHIALVHRLEWIVFPLIMLSLVPVGFYAFSQGPLLYEMLVSTYGPSIFKRDRKEKIH